VRSWAARVYRARSGRGRGLDTDLRRSGYPRADEKVREQSVSADPAPGASAIREATFVPAPDMPSGTFVLLRLVAVPVLGFVAFGGAIAIGVPANRIAMLGIATALGTLILTVAAVDRTRPRERRNLLLSLFSFSYICFFVLPVFVFYLGETGYTLDMSPN